MFDKLTGLITNNVDIASQINTVDSRIVPLIGVILIIVMFLFMIAVYVYTSWALMRIAKRAKTEPAWLAWIPIANNYLLAKIAKMHWWPLILGIIGGILALGGILLLFAGLYSFDSSLLITAFPLLFIGGALVITFTVFSYIWYWKMFEAVGRPGWWALMSLIPYAGGIIFLVLLGVAAWGKAEKR